MNKQAAFAADDKPGGARNEDTILVQGVVSGELQLQRAVAAQADAGLHGAVQIDLGEHQLYLFVVRDADVHIHTVGFFPAQRIFARPQEETGILPHGQVQQVHVLARHRLIEQELVITLGKLEILIADFLQDFFGNRPDRLLRRTAGVETLDQVDAAFNDGAELLRGLHAFRQRTDAVLVRELNGVADEKPAVGIGGDAGDETAVNLDDLRRITQEIQDV